MRTTILIAVLCLNAPAYACEEVREYAKEHGVKCWGGDVGTCTAMNCPSGYYDENGDWVPPKACNTCTFLYQCEDGEEIECKDSSIWSY